MNVFFFNFLTFNIVNLRVCSLLQSVIMSFKGCSILLYEFQVNGIQEYFKETNIEIIILNVIAI